MGILTKSGHLSQITYELQFKIHSNKDVCILLMFPGFGSKLICRQSKKHNFTTQINHEVKISPEDGDRPTQQMNSDTGTKGEGADLSSH